MQNEVSQSPTQIPTFEQLTTRASRDKRFPTFEELTVEVKSAVKTGETPPKTVTLRLLRTRDDKFSLFEEDPELTKREGEVTGFGLGPNFDTPEKAWQYVASHERYKKTEGSQ